MRMSLDELRNLAQEFKDDLNLNFTEESVKYVEGFIERVKGEMSEEQIEGLIVVIGSFLGECIIRNYGGMWDEESENCWAAKFDDRNKAFPFTKVSKQFDNGLEDSIYSFFTAIPTVFKFSGHSKK